MSRSRATQITGMLPYLVMMAVLYGALNAALDTTAGERERGSLEPLLMNPLERWVLVLGKWAAVASVGMLIAVLSADAALMAIATDGVFFNVGPSSAQRFVVLALPGTTDTEMFGGVAFETAHYEIKSVIMNGSSDDSAHAASLIDADLVGLESRLAPAALVSHGLVLVQREQRIRYTETDPKAVDVRWQHRGGLYEVWTQPISA